MIGWYHKESTQQMVKELKIDQIIFLGIFLIF